MEPVVQPGYLSLKRAAQWADVSPKTIQSWIASGLPVYQGIEGGKVLVKPSDIDQFFRVLRRAAQTASERDRV